MVTALTLLNTYFRFTHPSLPACAEKMAAPVAVHLEFGGGAELLFDGVKEHHVTLPSQPEPCEYHLSPQ
ncbi:hypothetical protein AMECASPLE_016770 [Ameca splendens]|uniref:Uncharacterized protein n=1 Tax=Ameca splendens TaxID=208324 RepID=A0ABV0YPD7_9TELE